MKKSLWSAVALVLTLAASAFSAVPGQINFQGRLTDSGGNPVANGSYSVIFKIYDAETGGTALWTETQSVATNGGVFSVLLGSVAAIPDSVFYDSLRYLAIKVASDLEMAPRQKLASTGYSFVSSQWTSAGENLFRLNGNVGIGTVAFSNAGSPELQIRAVNSSNAGWVGVSSFDETSSIGMRSGTGGDGSLIAFQNNVGFGSVTGNGTTGFVERMRITSSGNVGIGTASPEYLLDVAGYARFQQGGGVPFIVQTPPSDVRLFSTSSVPVNIGTAGNAFMLTVAPSGNVGIGTTSPENALHVQGGIRSRSHPLDPYYADFSSAYNYLESFNLSVRGGDAAETKILSFGNTDTWLSSYGASRALTIKGFSGNVGIGTTSPAARLQVSGNSSSALSQFIQSGPSNAIYATTPGILNVQSAIYGEATATGDAGGVGIYGVTNGKGIAEPDPNAGSAIGVYGVAKSITTTGGATFGVLGRNFGGKAPTYSRPAGVLGEGMHSTLLSDGVQGQTFSSADGSAGVIGWANKTTGRTFGVSGETNSLSNGAAGVRGSADASSGQIRGVWGSTNSTTDGAAGVLGAAVLGGVGVRGEEPAGGTGFAMYADGDMKVVGNMTCMGGKCAVVPTHQGQTLVYSQESPEVWFEDFGEGKLKDGQAHVELDQLFLETVTINGEHPMKVFIQPNDDFTAYVKRSNTGFDVIQTGGEENNGHFSYRIVAKRKGFENKRLEVVVDELSQTGQESKTTNEPNIQN